MAGKSFRSPVVRTLDTESSIFLLNDGKNEEENDQVLF